MYSDPFNESGSECPVCTGDCLGFPDTQHRHDYPFVGGGVDHMAQEPADAYIAAPHRIDNPDGGPALYGVGDPIPRDEAVRLGLIAADKPAAEKKAPAKRAARAKKGPAEDRAKKPAEDRAKK